MKTMTKIWIGYISISTIFLSKVLYCYTIEADYISEYERYVLEQPSGPVNDYEYQSFGEWQAANEQREAEWDRRIGDECASCFDWTRD